MAKAKTKFVCTDCGENYSSWSGKCTSCGNWNTIQQVLDVSNSGKAQQAIKSGQELSGRELSQVASSKKSDNSKRIAVGIADMNAILGGGIVPGSVTLIAGQPGIGKSTLLLQLAYDVSKKCKLLYISGEESVEQIAMRGQRLSHQDNAVMAVASNNANDIASTIASGKYDVVVVDSIQTVSLEEISGVPGSVSQVTNSAQLITLAAKQSNTAVIMVGHVTKEGSIAGPKVLEHLVDVVLQLEGDRYADFRILRGIKNRYGSTNEASILEMAQNGLSIVENPSAALLEERQVSDGSIVLATLEGNRPVLVEVQALVNPTSYGYPKRAASGYDLSRLNLLIAMLERRTKLKLADKDIFINIVGGIKITENAADLAICMAIASATKGMQLSDDAVVFGEVGLSGEVRRVPMLEKRVYEAEKLGFKSAIGPKPAKSLKSDIKYLTAHDLRGVLNAVLQERS